MPESTKGSYDCSKDPKKSQADFPDLEEYNTMSRSQLAIVLEGKYRSNLRLQEVQQEYHLQVRETRWEIAKVALLALGAWLLPTLAVRAMWRPTRN